MRIEIHASSARSHITRAAAAKTVGEAEYELLQARKEIEKLLRLRRALEKNAKGSPMTVVEAAALLNLHPGTIRNMIKSGKLLSTRTSSGTVLVVAGFGLAECK